MFNEDTIGQIKKKVIKDMKMYSVKPDEYKDFVHKKINYEVDKYKEENKTDSKITLYDNVHSEAEVNNFNIVYDDYIGKNEELNVKNSYEDESLFKYKDNNKVKNIHLIFEKILNSIIFDYKMLFFFDKKNVSISVAGFIFKIISLFLKSIFLAITGIFDVAVYFLFKLLKKMIRLKYSKNVLIRNNFVVFYAIEVLKFVIGLINGFFMLFNNIFINNVNIFIDYLKNTTSDFIYSKPFLNYGKVDRYGKSEEQRKFLEVIKKNRIAYLKSLLEKDKNYFADINFSQLATKTMDYKNINNKHLRKYYKRLEKNMKITIKNEIISERLIKKRERYERKVDNIANKLRSINNSLLKIANKDKELYKMLVKKLGKNGLEI